MAVAVTAHSVGNLTVSSAAERHSFASQDSASRNNFLNSSTVTQTQSASRPARSARR